MYVKIKRGRENIERHVYKYVLYVVEIIITTTIFIFLLILYRFIKLGSGSSVGMIMVQFEDSLRQRSEVQISIRSSYSEKIFYEKKKFDDLWAHYHGLHSQPSDTY